MDFKSFCKLLLTVLVANGCNSQFRQYYGGKLLHTEPNKECTSSTHPGVVGVCTLSLACQQKINHVIIGSCRNGLLFGACCANSDPSSSSRTETSRPSSSTSPSIKIPESLLKLANFNIAAPNTVIASHLSDSLQSVSTNPPEPSTTTTTVTPSSTTTLSTSTPRPITTSQVTTEQPTSPPSTIAVTTELTSTSTSTTLPTTTTPKFVYGKLKYSPRPQKQRPTTAKIFWTRPPSPTTETSYGVLTGEEMDDDEEEEVEMMPHSSSSSTSRKPVPNPIPEGNASIEDAKTTTMIKLADENVPEETTLDGVTGPVPTVGSIINGSYVGMVRKLSRLSNDINDMDNPVPDGWDNQLNDLVNQVVEGIAVELDKSNIDDVLFKESNSSKSKGKSKLTTTTTTPKPSTKAKKKVKPTPKTKKTSKNKLEKVKTSSTTTAKPKRKNKPNKKFPPTTPENVEEVEDERDVLDYREVCGVRPLVRRQSRIVGGNPSTHGNWPWHALVKETVWWGLFSKIKCGGVLIGSRYVLTAAHCQPQQTGTLSVVLGVTDSDNPSTNAITKGVRRIVRHPHFNPRSYENDIAILELDSPVPFHPHIVPICLPDIDEDFAGMKGFVTGMGLLKHDGERPSMLYEVDVPILNNADCQKMFRRSGNMKPIKPSFICAGYRNGRKDSCGGDSGGPLAVQKTNGQWVLAGTVSHGIKCAVPNQPGVYMRTTWYKPWIDTVTRRMMNTRTDMPMPPPPPQAAPPCHGPPSICEYPQARGGRIMETLFRVLRLARKLIML